MDTNVHAKPVVLGMRMVSMGLAHLLMNAYAFALFSLFHLHMQEQGTSASSMEGAGGDGATFWTVLAFLVGVFAPGAFGAYLLERFSRKAVFAKSVLLFTAVGVSYAYFPGYLYWVVPAFFMQGVAYGMAQMALGTTLVNDLTQAQCRTRANNAYVWYGRFGCSLGLVLGVNLPLLTGRTSECIVLVAAAGLLSVLLVLALRVPVKAPVKVRLVALDRFLLPAAVVRVVPSMFVALCLGSVVSSHLHARGWFFLALGQLVALLLPTGLKRVGRGRVMKCAGLVLSVIAAVLLHDVLPGGRLEAVGVSAFFVLGVGSALALERTLLGLVGHVEHCQRGTAQNTYYLVYGLFLAVGMLFL